MSSTIENESSLPESWQVDLPMFEGPLDLLLHLVRVNEVEITEIPVIVICDQFQEYLHLMEELNLDIAAEYIYEAALLIFLKSRMLLPRQSEESDDSGDDPREDLVQRLLEYRRMKDAAQSLAEIHTLRQGVWTRPHQKLPEIESDETIDFGEVSLFDLLGAFKQVVVRYEHEHPPPWHVKRDFFSVRGQFERLLERLAPQRPLDLVEDLRDRSCRAEAVAAFLAVLELARLRLVRVHRTDKGDLLLSRTPRELQQHELEAIQG